MHAPRSNQGPAPAATGQAEAAPRLEAEVLRLLEEKVYERVRLPVRRRRLGNNLCSGACRQQREASTQLVGALRAPTSSYRGTPAAVRARSAWRAQLRHRAVRCTVHARTVDTRPGCASRTAAARGAARSRCGARTRLVDELPRVAGVHTHEHGDHGVSLAHEIRVGQPARTSRRCIRGGGAPLAPGTMRSCAGAWCGARAPARREADLQA